MNPTVRLLVRIAVISAIALGAIGAGAFWLVPSFHHLRTMIDNDRASAVVIVQQQSNLNQLTKDIESIQAKQVGLEAHVWVFLNEDNFFSAIDTIAKTKAVVIDPPTIADATPTGSILPRAVTLTIHGSLDHGLEAVKAVQAVTPLIAIQQLEVAPDAKPGDTLITLTASSLWK